MQVQRHPASLDKILELVFPARLQQIEIFYSKGSFSQQVGLCAQLSSPATGDGLEPKPVAFVPKSWLQWAEEKVLGRPYGGPPRA